MHLTCKAILADMFPRRKKHIKSSGGREQCPKNTTEFKSPLGLVYSLQTFKNIILKSVLMGKKTKKTKKSLPAAVKDGAASEEAEIATEIPETLTENTAKELNEVKAESSLEKEEEIVGKKEEPKEDKKEKKKPILSMLAGERVITESSDDARELFNQSRFGALAENGKVELSLLEALYLLERRRLIINSEAGKEIVFEMYVKKARKVEPNFWIRYCVFKDMRNRGYIIKTALKFGADFRVYDRGVKPGEDHAKWIVYPVHEASVFTWYEFSAKNRVAHSTKKRLLLGVVDDENDVTYYEVRWMRP